MSSTGPSVTQLRALLDSALHEFDSLLAYQFALRYGVIPDRLPIRGIFIKKLFFETLSVPNFVHHLRLSLLPIPGTGIVWTMEFIDIHDLQSFASRLSPSGLQEFAEDPSLRFVSFQLQSLIQDNRQSLFNAVRLAGLATLAFFRSHFPEFAFPEDDWVDTGFPYSPDIWLTLTPTFRMTTLIILVAAIGSHPFTSNRWSPRDDLIRVIHASSLDPIKEAQMVHVLQSIYSSPSITTFTLHVSSQVSSISLLLALAHYPPLTLPTLTSWVASKTSLLPFTTSSQP